jgi:hypothetical protein
MKVGNRFTEYPSNFVFKFIVGLKMRYFCFELLLICALI